MRWIGGWTGGCAVRFEEHTSLVTLALLLYGVTWGEISGQCKKEVTASNDQSSPPIPIYVFQIDE